MLLSHQPIYILLINFLGLHILNTFFIEFWIFVSDSLHFYFNALLRTKNYLLLSITFIVCHISNMRPNIDCREQNDTRCKYTLILTLDYSNSIKKNKKYVRNLACKSLCFKLLWWFLSCIVNVR